MKTRCAPMNGLDHTLLRMDTPQHLVVLHLVFVLRGRLLLERLAQTMRERLLVYPQFTHRIDRGWLRAGWVTDEHFALDRHLDERHFPPGSTRRDLQTWIADQASHPLPYDRPLWKATLAQGIDGGSALVMRVHHSLADGMSLMHLIGELTDIADGEQPKLAARPSVRSELTLKRAFGQGRRLLTDMTRLLFPVGDWPSPLKGEPQQAKSVAWSAPLSLEAIRAVAHRHAATVNDAVLAVVSDALRQRVLARLCTRVTGPVRALVPISMRAPGDERLLGNCFGLVGPDLPIHLEDPLQRLIAVRDSMNAFKHSFQSHLALAVLRRAGHLPAAIQSALLGLWARRCTVVVTNVISPAEARDLGNVRIDELVMLVPPVMSVGVGISILSYDGAVRIGFLVDNELMPLSELAAMSITSCFENLQRAAGIPGSVIVRPAVAVKGESVA